MEARFELCEETYSSDHLCEELPDRSVRLAPQGGQLAPELLQPMPSLVGQPIHLVEMLERLGEEERRCFVFVFIAPAKRAVLIPGPSGHSSEVLEPHAIAGPQEDAGQRHAGEGVGDRSRVRQHLDDLGQLEQAGQADDLDRDLQLAQSLLQWNEQAALPREDGEARPRIGARI